MPAVVDNNDIMNIDESSSVDSDFIYCGLARIKRCSLGVPYMEDEVTNAV